MIHIHENEIGLMFFTDKNGVPAYNSRIFAYAMQEADIVGIFYTKEQAESFYELNRFKDNLPVLYKWNQELWDKRNINWGTIHRNSE